MGFKIQTPDTTIIRKAEHIPIIIPIENHYAARISVNLFASRLSIMEKKIKKDKRITSVLR